MKKKFLKVYKAPGYPIDPKLQDSRNADRWINSIVNTEPNRLPSDFVYGINYANLDKYLYARRS